jgi:hypothetical protein
MTLQVETLEVKHEHKVWEGKFVKHHAMKTYEGVEI